MRNDRPNLIVDLTLEFSVEIIEFSELLQSKGKNVIANQIIRSGTSIGANVREAQNAESKKDFIHKLKIAAEVADETQYWLELSRLSKGYPENSELELKLESIIKVLSKIISSSKTSKLSS